MLESGEGSTGVIAGYRGPNAVGHFFNVTVKNGEVVFLDFQKTGSAVMKQTEFEGYKDLWFINTTGR